MTALLAGKQIVVHGGGGSVGGTLARVFAQEGAAVHLAGRTLGPLQRVAEDLGKVGGTGSVAEVDAMDEVAVERHAQDVASSAGRLDAVVNAVGPRALQGIPLLELPTTEFVGPVQAYATTVFLTTRAAARQMIATGTPGVVLMLSASAAGLPGHLTGGFGVSCGTVETMARHFAGELGEHGIRVVCLRPNKLGDQGDLGPELKASLESGTLTGRLPTLRETAHTAAFLVSDHAGSITGTVVNMTAGAIVD